MLHSLLFRVIFVFALLFVALLFFALAQCSATFSYSRHTKTLSKFSQHTSAKSAENLHIKSTVLIIFDPKGKFYPMQSESTATSHAPKPTSKQPHIPQEMCYTYTQTEAFYLLTENIEFENKNAPALCRMDCSVVNGNCNYRFLLQHSPKLRCCTLG